MQNRTTSFLSCTEYTRAVHRGTVSPLMGDPAVELQIQVFRDLDELLASLSPQEWATETECPGWSVQDNVSHIIGTESMLLGRDAPAHDPGEKPWVKNPIGANNEVQVDYRALLGPRAGPGRVPRGHVRAHRRYSKASRTTSWAAESWTPIGPGTVRDLVAIRVMDCWVHEQDIRRAIGTPGGLEGPVAEHAFRRHARRDPVRRRQEGRRPGRVDRRHRRRRRSGRSRSVWTASARTS